MHIYGRIYVTITRQFHLLDNNRFIYHVFLSKIMRNFIKHFFWLDCSPGSLHFLQIFEYMHDVLNANANKVHEMRKSKVQHASIYHQSAMF